MQERMRISSLLTIGVLALGLFACSAAPGGGAAPAPDGGDDAAPDGGDDAAPDGGDDAAPDGGDDAAPAPDGGDDAAPDGGDTFPAPLARRSLTVLHPYAVAPGDGFSGELRTGAILSTTCAQGTISSAKDPPLSAGGWVVTTESGLGDQGSADLGAQRVADFLPATPATPEAIAFAQAAAASPTTLTTSRFIRVDANSFSLDHATRVPGAAPCGDGYVSGVGAGRIFGYTFQVHFDDAARATEFEQRFGAQGANDVFTFGDRPAMSRFLRDHATLSILVVQGAGDTAATQPILDGSQCSIAALDACVETLRALDDVWRKFTNVAAHGDDTLASLSSDWGLYAVTTLDYATLP
jgi:hypothetical protein